MRKSASRWRRRASCARSPLALIRLTATENAAEAVLWPAIRKLLPEYPDIKVEVMIDYGLTDIVTEQVRCRRALRRNRLEGHDRGADRPSDEDGCRSPRRNISPGTRRLAHRVI